MRALQKRLHLTIIYMMLFIFSTYAIIQIRLSLVDATLSEGEGNLMLFLFRSQSISHHQFIMLKITLFVLVAIISYVLMLSNYFLYHHPDRHETIIRKVNKEVKEEVKKRNLKPPIYPFDS